MIFLKKALGWSLICMGGLVTLVCVLCTGMYVIGEIGGGLELLGGFLAVGAGAYGVLRLGMGLIRGFPRKKAPEKKPKQPAVSRQEEAPPAEMLTEGNFRRDAAVNGVDDV